MAAMAAKVWEFAKGLGGVQEGRSSTPDDPALFVGRIEFLALHGELIQARLPPPLVPVEVAKGGARRHNSEDLAREGWVEIDVSTAKDLERAKELIHVAHEGAARLAWRERPPPDYLYTIEDGQIAGSPGPTRVEWDLAALKEAGFTVVVSFECERLDPEAIRVAGMEHKMICVEDFTAPTGDQLYEFNEFVDRKLREGTKVLTHCFAGRGRTGTFLASRLVWRGAPVDKAVEEVRAKIMEAQGTLAGAIEPGQVEALHHFARTLRSRR